MFIQSFESGNLRELRSKTPVRLIQLVDARGDARRRRAEGRSPTYADGIGPEKRLVIPVGAGRHARRRRPISCSARTRPACWSTSGRIRIDKEFLPAGYEGRAEAEFEQFRDLGVDGIFTDFPDVAAKVLRSQPRSAS